jgi:hypothetical protein
MINVSISSQYVAIKEQSLQLSQTVDQRSTAQFVVEDAAGTGNYRPGQFVQITDTVLGVLFSGYINDVQSLRLYPAVNREHTIQCVDMHYLADKRSYSGNEYVNRYAGDIASDLLQNVLSAEGVTASYSVRRDTSTAQFNQGTLSNVTGASNLSDGDLELASAGSTVTITENTTATFNTGTLTNATASNNMLVPSSVQALHLQGTSQQGSGSSNNNYIYYKIWQGTSITINNGDNFVYTLWISSTSPMCTGGMDFVCTDGTTLRDSVAQDQEGLSAHPKTDLSGYANDKWFTRTINLNTTNGLSGKTLSYVSIVQEGDNNGTYDIYAYSCTLQDSLGNVRQTFFGSTLSRTPTIISDAGYSSTSCKVVTAYLTPAVRVSPSYNIASVGIVRSSIVNWTIDLGGVATVATQGSDKVNYITIESSLDGGATWFTCTNHSPIPNLIAGYYTLGQSLLFRQTLNIAAPDPSIAPTLQEMDVTIYPSYAATVTSVTQGYSGVAGNSWASQSNSGTTTNFNNDLTLNGFTRNWFTDISNRLNNITLFGTNPAANISQANSAYAIRCDAASDVRARLDFAGQWQNGIIEVDVFLSDAVGNYGVVYRCTNWGNSNDSYAYNAYISTTQIELAHGNNSTGTGAFTAISIVSASLASNTWYHLKVIFNGTNHQVWLNDVQYINVTDSTYTAAGYIGLRHFNGNASGGARHSGYFQSFGVMSALSGTWTTNNISLNALGYAGSSVIEWNDTTPDNTTLAVQTSIDGGTTWATCTKNAAIPNIIPGASMASKNLLIQATLTSQNANATPQLHGLGVIINSIYSATGSRISPAQSLANVTRAGSTAVAWNATVPKNTTLSISTSTDGINFSSVGTGASGTGSIPQITAQPAALFDGFSTNTSYQYSQTIEIGGAASTWTWDTANGRVIATGGTNGVLLYQSTSGAEIDATWDMDTANGGGLVWSWSNASNFYKAIVYDASATSNANTLKVVRVASGVETVMTSIAIAFTRGSIHRFRITQFSSVVIVYMDGVQIGTATGSSTSGYSGLISGSSTNQFYFLYSQIQGQIVSSLNIYTKATLTSSDPTATPQLQDISTTVTAPQIAIGALIPSTQYSVLSGSKNTASQDLDDLASKSNFTWYIDQNKQLNFTSRSAQIAPFIISDSDMYVNNFNVDYADNLYRNDQWVTDGNTVISVTESRTGDGSTQSWALAYPVDSISSLTVNGASYSTGIRGIDTSAAYLYEVGNNVLSQNTSNVPLLASQTLTITYNGQVNIVVEVRNSSEITARSNIDQSSGIINAVESTKDAGTGTTKQDMITLASARLTQYTLSGKTVTFTTTHQGLAIGQLAHMYSVTYNLLDALFLITDVQTTWRTVSINGVSTLQAVYAITAVAGPIVPNWARFFSKLYGK